MSRKTFPKKCPRCGNITPWFTGNICHNCYRRYKWNPMKKECICCHRIIKIHAKGYCAGCYNTTFHLERTKAYNHKKYHNIEDKIYKKITKICIICGFDKVVELHHLDHNHQNNSEDNFVGLCPNHHKMLHNLKYRDEIKNQIKEKLALKQPENN